MQTLLPLKISAKRDAWSGFQNRLRDKSFKSIAESVFKRDAHTCRFCGFKSPKHNYVINLDHNYRNNNSANMVTACPFCTQCFFIDGIGGQRNFGGYLIYLPEISQADLNNYCRLLFCSLLGEASYKTLVFNTYLSMRDRKNVIEKAFGPDSSLPEVFGNTIIDSTFSSKIANKTIMENIKLLPERRFFEEEILYWRYTVFDEIII